MGTKKRRVFALGLAATMLLTISGCRTEAETETEPDSEPSQSEGQRRLGYEEGVTIVDSEEALQAAVDEMLAKAENQMILSYQNEAFSEDGTNVSCYIANAEANEYDMFINVFSDAELTDELYLSGLVRPGNAIETLTLNHALEPGIHTVYVAFTQVEEDLETIHGQLVVTMDFTVSE